MIKWKTTLLRFGKKGEKTGWTYIEIPADIAQKLKPGNKKSFRVKGKLDDFSFSATAILPMGEGDFILPVNAAFRKGIKKKHGAMLVVQMQEDKKEVELNKDFLACLAEEKKALDFFNSFPGSHQRYYSKWIESAKTEETKAKRIAKAVNALARKLNYAEMLREGKEIKR
jgi:hypothetical protein